MPERIEKTVFISYRRTNSFMARAVYQSLTAKGFDVFFDFEGINSGDFEQIILGNLRAKAHFLVILTPSALERCVEPGDWLRREIETAIDEKRNIVPLFFEGFNFSSPSIAQYLTGKLAMLKDYNGLNVPADYFNEAIDRLITRFLNIPLDAVLHPLSSDAKRGAAVQKVAAESAAAVTENDLSAEAFFEEGYKQGEAGQYDEAIRNYTEAIQNQPEYPRAFYNRGVNRAKKGDFSGAILDYTEAIRLQAIYPEAYYNRGTSYNELGEHDAAIKDLTKAIQQKPGFADAYFNRAYSWNMKKDYYSAIADYEDHIKFGGARKKDCEKIIRDLKSRLKS